MARTVELVRSLDPDTPALVSFDQPWAEYMRQRESDFPPLHFADALIRAGLGLAGLMLEINVGYSPGGTLPRHPLEFSRLLDAWSLLGLPLWLSLCAPSAYHEDPLAQAQDGAAAGQLDARRPSRRGSPASCRWRWPSRWCRGWYGTNSATASRTISLTAGCSTTAVRPSSRCGTLADNPPDVLEVRGEGREERGEGHLDCFGLRSRSQAAISSRTCFDRPHFRP